MIDHIGITVSNYEASKKFYSDVLGSIDYRLMMEVDGFAGFGANNEGGAIASFWLHEDKTKLDSGVHIAFTAKTREQVDRFYQLGLKAGGVDNGKPGLREIYHPHYYGAFILDIDGYNIEVVCHR